MRVPDEKWRSFVKNNPIFSIDIIIFNKNHGILMGMRLNNPAKGMLFVPGGRVFKNETREKGFERIIKSETGLNIKFKNSLFLGLFEHFYENSKWPDKKISTHYIVEARFIEIKYKIEKLLKPDSQHSDLFSIDKNSRNSYPIHKNCYPYFDYILKK